MRLLFFLNYLNILISSAFLTLQIISRRVDLWFGVSMLTESSTVSPSPSRRGKGTDKERDMYRISFSCYLYVHVFGDAAIAVTCLRTTPMWWHEGGWHVLSKYFSHDNNGLSGDNGLLPRRQIPHFIMPSSLSCAHLITSTLGITLKPSYNFGR